MKRVSHILISIFLALCVTACCSSKKPTNLPAKEVLPDRNTKDPKIDSTQKKVEKATVKIKAE